MQGQQNINNDISVRVHPMFFLVGSHITTNITIYLLTPCSRFLSEKLTGSQLVKKFLHFMKPKGLLPHL